MGRRSKRYKTAAKKAARFYESNIFDEFVGLSLFLVVFLAIMLTFQDTISSVVLFNVIMTLGGQIAYTDMVYGLTILFLIGGILFIMESN